MTDGPRLAHVRVVTRRPDRRINGRPGASYNLCGAAATDRDVLLRDARCLGTPALDAWNVCRACREKMETP